MRIWITSDTWWESRIEEATHALHRFSFEQFFEPRDYGPGLVDIGIVLMCREPELNFRQRIRYRKRDKALDMDVMIHLPGMVAADTMGRIRIVSGALYDEVPRVVSKYKLKDFDTLRFVAEWQSWFDQTGWLKATD